MDRDLLREREQHGDGVLAGIGVVRTAAVGSEVSRLGHEVVQDADSRAIAIRVLNGKPRDPDAHLVGTGSRSQDRPGELARSDRERSITAPSRT